MKIKLILNIFIIVFFIGCVPLFDSFVPVIDLTGVNQQDLIKSQKIRTYLGGQMPPDEFTLLEPLEAWSCEQ